MVDPSALPTFHEHTTAAEVAAALAPWITNRTILITGVSPGGIGFETARVVAHHSPKLLILAGRTPANNAEAERKIREEVPNVKTKTWTVDLGSFAGVRDAVGELRPWGLEEEGGIDVLLNNAAIMGGPFKLSPDGIESQFATNHLGTFLLTNLLSPLILLSPSPRIVNVSSRGHYRTDINLADVNFSSSPYDPLLAYGRSKTANILFAVSLAARLKKHNGTAFSLHPGAIPTNLGRSNTDADWEVHIRNGLVDENRRPLKNDWVIWKSVEEGAATGVVAAFDPRIEEMSGGYLTECQVTRDKGLVRRYALDGENAERLWGWSEEVVGETFEW